MVENLTGPVPHLMVENRYQSAKRTGAPCSGNLEHADAVLGEAGGAVRHPERLSPAGEVPSRRLFPEPLSLARLLRKHAGDAVSSASCGTDDLEHADALSGPSGRDL